jgi:oleandomycin transport system ATP-binding protein
MAGSMTDPAIVVESLAKRFGKVEALKGVDLEVPPSTVLGMLGPNGAGKTTTVRILTTLLGPDEGRATVAGYDVVKQAEELRHVIGLAGQNAAVDENLTGLENLEMVGRLYHVPAAEARRRGQEILERFELSDAAHRVAKTYSGGMRRRLDLGASLVGRPQVLFLDEPTTGLDPRGRMEMWDVIRDLRTEGTTLLLTTQYLDEADELADEIAVIDHGRVIASGAPDELKAKTGAQSLEVRPADEADLPTVVSVVGELAGVAPEVQGQHVTAPVVDPALLPAAVRRLDDAGVVITELALRSSSLNEVFLSLTGRPAEETDEDDDTEGAPA